MSGLTAVPEAQEVWTPPRGREVLHRAALRVLGLLLSLCSRTDRVGTANLPSGGPVIVVGNHCSVADGVVLVTTVARAGRLPRMMGTAGLFSAPVLGPLLRFAGYIPVHRRSANPAAALAPAAAALAAGECVGLYPEGEITRHPDLWPNRARTGVVRLALDSGAPVVPVAQWGTPGLLGPEGTRHRAWLAPFTRPRIEVAVGLPLDLRTMLGVGSAGEASVDQLRAGADLVMDALCDALEVLAGSPRPAGAGRRQNPPREPEAVPGPAHLPTPVDVRAVEPADSTPAA